MSDLLTRRQFIRLASGITLSLQGCSGLKLTQGNGGASQEGSLFAQFSPMDRTVFEEEPKSFFGDNPGKSHKILWDLTGFLKSQPTPSSEVTTSVAVVGGGISGLSTAYLLRDLKPVVLDQAERFGGNSKGQSWRGQEYSLGAAYFFKPGAETELGKFFEEIGALRGAHKSEDSTSVLMNGKWVSDFFSGNVDAKQSKVFIKYVQLMQKYLNAPGLYPDITAIDLIDRRNIQSLDKYTLAERLQKELGTLPPILEQWIEHYCWSSFGASANEISAAAGINFLAGEFGDVYYHSGGNSVIAEKIVSKLSKTLPAENLVPSALVIQVKRQDGLWNVDYVDKAGELRRVRARAVVMACPKFVVTRLVPTLPSVRLAMMQKVQYRAYLVTNVLIEGKVKVPAFDNYLVDSESENKKSSIEEKARTSRSTDLIVGSYKSDSKNTVLTLYRGFPYASGRSELIAPTAWDKYQAEARTQLEKEILPALGVKMDQVRGIRLARWGHAMPVPVKGCYRPGYPEFLSEPFDKSMFFVNQDNWLLPALETAASEALRWAPEVRRSLDVG